jgi:hypothetical protein
MRWTSVGAGQPAMRLGLGVASATAVRPRRIKQRPKREGKGVSQFHFYPTCYDVFSGIAGLSPQKTGLLNRQRVVSGVFEWAGIIPKKKPCQNSSAEQGLKDYKGAQDNK